MREISWKADDQIQSSQMWWNRQGVCRPIVSLRGQLILSHNPKQSRRPANNPCPHCGSLFAPLSHAWQPHALAHFLPSGWKIQWATSTVLKARVRKKLQWLTLFGTGSYSSSKWRTILDAGSGWTKPGYLRHWIIRCWKLASLGRTRKFRVVFRISYCVNHELCT